MKLTKEYLNKLSPVQQKEAIIKEYIKCKKDIKYCIETYFTVVDNKTRVPFKLFPHQIETLSAYETYNYNITMKTRRMGYTTFTAAYIGHKVNFINNFKVIIISKTKTDSKKFLKEVKDIMDEARRLYPWLISDYTPGYNNKESVMFRTGSSISAEAATEEAGRGDACSLLVCDEVASIDRRSPEKMAEIWGSASPTLATTKGKAIMISTPRGMTGWYYDTYTNAKKMGFHIIDAHWIKHPNYSKGTYQWIVDVTEKEGGHLKWYNIEWPDELFDSDAGMFIKIPKKKYNFILDGKIRSPWYDNESNKLGKRRTACELDCSFVGTGGEVIDSSVIRNMRLYAETIEFTNPFAELKGIYRKFKKYKEWNPEHKYVIAADVATGDGSDYSTMVVYDLTTNEICATYKEQLLPETFALILKVVGQTYGYCQIVVENQGGGTSTLQELKRQQYNNLFYSNLQKKDPSTGMKKRKIGLWASEDVRWQGGNKLESMIVLEQLKIPCLDIIDELQTWIWDKDGKRRHAPEKHDDLLMALQHAVWYANFVHYRSEKNKTNFKSIFEIDRNGRSTKIQFADTDLGRGNIVPQYNNYLPNMSGVTSQNASASYVRAMGGGIDNTVDTRLLSQEEIEEVEKRKLIARNRRFLT